MGGNQLVVDQLRVTAIILVQIAKGLKIIGIHFIGTNCQHIAINQSVCADGPNSSAMRLFAIGDHSAGCQLLVFCLYLI